MLYSLFAVSESGHGGLFNLFHYLTFRSGGACLTALVISLSSGSLSYNISDAASATASPSGN